MIVDSPNKAIVVETADAANTAFVPDSPTVGRSRTQIIKDSGHYLAATLVAQGVALVRSLMMPILFMPAQMGVWNLMNVVISYGEKAQLGLLDGMNKAIPLMRGEGRHDRTDAMKDSVFWVNLMLAAVAGLVTWLASWFAPQTYAPSLRIVAVVVFLQLPFSYLFSILRVDNRFGLLSRGVVALSICSTILILLLGLRSSDALQGALIGLAAAYALTVFYWSIAGRYSFAFRIKLDSLREALVLGVPLKMLGVFDAVFLSVDRWIIVAMLGETMLGYYAVAIMVSNLLGLVPGSVASVVYTRMLERYATDKHPRAIRTLLTMPLRALMALMLVLSSCAMIAVPVVITIFMPRYVISIPLVQTLVAGGVFLSIGLFTGTYLIAINRQGLMMKVQIAATLLSIVGNTLVVNLGYGVQGVAMVTSFAYMCIGFGYTIPAIWFVCGDRIETMKMLVNLVVLVMVMLTATAGAHFLFPAGGSSIREFFSGLNRLALVLGCVMFALWWVNRDGELLAIIRAELRNFRWFSRCRQ